MVLGESPRNAVSTLSVYPPQSVVSPVQVGMYGHDDNGGVLIGIPCGASRDSGSRTTHDWASMEDPISGDRLVSRWIHAQLDVYDLHMGACYVSIQVSRHGSRYMHVD